MMTDFTDRTTCTLPSASHQSKCAGSSVDKIAPTHTRDNPQTDITHADDIPPSRGSTPQEPNIDKDLPDIPSGSKELWGSEPVLERLRSKVVCLPNEADSIVITSNAGPLAGSWFNSATSSEVSNGQILDDSSSEGCPSADTSSEISSLPVTPIIRRIFAWELAIAHIYSETEKILNRIDQDGNFPCPRTDCYDLLLTREAYDSHTHIHLIHERLKMCELCGMRFGDEEHKDEHLNSCPMLPAFDDIKSFNAESEHVGHLQSLLNIFHH